MAAVVRPFRGLRPVPARVDPGALVGDGVIDSTAAAPRDPRNVALLLSGDAARARFLVAEQLRSGVMSRDRLPSLYVLKLQAPEGARTGFFAVVRADSVDVDGADAGVDAAALARLQGFGVAIEPVVISYVDKKGRVARSLESETEREPDASFTWNQQACELWAVDDDSAAARVTALLEGAALAVKHGGSALARQRGLVNDDHAGGYALAFFVDDEAPLTRAPLGVVLHSIEGTL